METWDAITARRQVRSFTDQPVKPEDLDRILEAGRRAPSAANRQWWDFVVVTDKAQQQELSKVWQGAAFTAGAAATIALVAPIPEDARGERMIHFDLGQAAMQMLIAAAGLGIGTGLASATDQDLARRVLGLPEDRALAFVIGVGYPADRPLRPMVKPKRRPFEEVVHRGRW